tara:strand:- start:86 stop:250 length:165 start_codon:yes stop_codon:yes gene_type:complete
MSLSRNKASYLQKFFLMLFLAVALISCGNKGPLVIPDDFNDRDSDNEQTETRQL